MAGKRDASMSTPFVTVLIDTYNYGQYIEEAVESVLAQEFPREQREILVVDDGSTDDTPERLKKYGDEIRYVRKPNGGQASAFNLGFAAARGEIIATLDADDVWLPHKLRRVCETFENNPDAGMVYHRTYMWKDGEELEVDSHFANISGRVPENPVSLLVYAMVSTSCLAFRRNSLRTLLPVPDALRTQADAFLTALIIFAAPIIALPEFLGKYRIHGANRFCMSGIDSKLARNRIEQRMAMRSILSAEIRGWLGRKGRDLASQDLQAYLKQWTKAQEADSFALRKPHRWNYFLHLIEYPRVYERTMSPRHLLYSYLRAFGALLLGYDHLYLLDDFQKGYKKFFRSPAQKLSFSQDKTEATATGN
jgi:glycosyltransferase involved in cell wall biosynthesis